MEAKDIAFTVLTTDFFGYDLTEMKNEIPSLAVFVDHEHSAMKNFVRSLKYTDGPCVHMEDDIILCDNFYERITDIICRHENDVIQFFNMRKDDITLGTRYLDGEEFTSNCCFYLPAGMGTDMAKFAEVSRYGKKGHLMDYLVLDYLKRHKLKFLNWVPNLVDHKIGPSRLNINRRYKRQSSTFKKVQ